MVRPMHKIARHAKELYAAAWGQTIRFFGSQVNHQSHDGLCQTGGIQNAKTPCLDHAAQRCRATGHQHTVVQQDVSAVVSDQNRPHGHKHQRKSRLAGTGRPKDQNCALTHRHATCVQDGCGHTGRPTTNRAPSGSDVTSACVGRMFSAQITPPCASTICFEIARPRPEWLPKSPGGRSE